VQSDSRTHFATYDYVDQAFLPRGGSHTSAQHHDQQRYAGEHDWERQMVHGDAELSNPNGSRWL